MRARPEISARKTTTNARSSRQICRPHGHSHAQAARVRAGGARRGRRRARCGRASRAGSARRARRGIARLGRGGRPRLAPGVGGAGVAGAHLGGVGCVRRGRGGRVFPDDGRGGRARGRRGARSSSRRLGSVLGVPAGVSRGARDRTRRARTRRTFFRWRKSSSDGERRDANTNTKPRRVAERRERFFAVRLSRRRVRRGDVRDGGGGGHAAQLDRARSVRRALFRCRDRRAGPSDARDVREREPNALFSKRGEFSLRRRRRRFTNNVSGRDARVFPRRRRVTRRRVNKRTAHRPQRKQSRVQPDRDRQDARVERSVARERDDAHERRGRRLVTESDGVLRERRVTTRARRGEQRLRLRVRTESTRDGPVRTKTEPEQRRVQHRRASFEARAADARVRGAVDGVAAGDARDEPRDERSVALQRGGQRRERRSRRDSRRRRVRLGRRRRRRVGDDRRIVRRRGVIVARHVSRHGPGRS